MLLAIAPAAIGIPASAQQYPSKPVRIVVPFPPGGVDVAIRMIQSEMSANLGQPVVIENRPGANGYTGSEYVARTAADGYTLLATSSSTMVTGPALSRNVPFDPIRDFAPISMVVRSVNLLVVKPALPVSTVKEFIDYARRNPGKLSYGSTGVGSGQHLDPEIFKLATGIDIVHVPYKGFGPVVQALLAGEIETAFVTLQIIQPLLAAAKVRAIAVYDGRRYPGLPALPDVTETVPEFQKTPSWIGVLGPAALPRAITARLNASVVKAVNAPAVRAKLEETSIVVANTPEEFASALKTGLEQTIRVQKRLGIQLE
jgi:tripartite-type tricarboxylate transporter receptor subunit TctC